MELFSQSSSQSIEHLDNDSFVQLHLSKPSGAFLTSISDSRPLLATIDDVRGRSKKVAYLLQYFAVLSHGAYTDIQEKPSTRPEPLYFVQHSRSRISCHPCDTQASFSPTAVGISIHPDDIRAYERSGRCVPWHAVDTVVQIVDNLDAPNTANLLECLLKARPDLTGAYFLLLDKTVGRMRVGWYDASGVHYSQPYSIGQSPEILERFVYSFYYPLPGHPLYDSTLHMETPGIMEPTTWRITAGEHTYSKAKLIFSGEVIGRRTNVFKCEEGGQVSIIKDAYLPQTQLASESSFLQAVHSDGIVDAVVPLKSSITVQSAAGWPYTTLAAEDAAKHHRVLVKARLVLGASGVRLDNAKSVKDLCMAIFDANEALRELSRKGIFHRDMSPGNVLMYPSHDIKWAVRPGSSSTTQDVRYVKNVMENHPRDDTSSTALIIDFDRAAVANPNNPMTATLQYSKEILARRTGTPGYRARSVATTSVARRFRFCPMPKLGEQARELYINAYGQASHDTWEDKPQQVHGVPLVAKDDTASKVAFEYREEHDVEALFWVFIRTLLLATPKKTHPADTQEVLRSKAFRLGQCLEHFQQSNNAKDFRDELLRKTAEEWKTVLPTRLQSTIPLIVQLGRQVHPEYALLKEQPAPGHLHEAFRRILLNFIVKIKDPIPLLPGVRRSVHLEPTTVAATEIMLPQDVASGAIIPIANPAATRVAHTKLAESARNSALSSNEVYAENGSSTSLAEGRAIKPLRKTRPVQDIRAETSAIPGLPTSATSTRKRTREPGYADYTEDIQELMKACGLDSDTEGEESASSSPGKKRRCM